MTSLVAFSVASGISIGIFILSALVCVVHNVNKPCTKLANKREPYYTNIPLNKLQVP
jgi:DMSO reductase anchor subunit